MSKVGAHPKGYLGPQIRPLNSEPAETSYGCPSNLSKSERLLDDLTLFYEVANDNLCIRLEYDNIGWVGLGFSSSDGRMVGSTAVIGNHLDTKEPAYYALNGMADSMIALLPESKQTLSEAAISQENGLTVMRFAKRLVDDDHIDFGENTFIFAAGVSNHFGYHGSQRGSVTLWI